MTTLARVDHYGKCRTCGKLRYSKRSRARKVAKTRHRGEHMSAYRCGGYWHIGHIPTSMLRGQQ